MDGGILSNSRIRTKNGATIGLEGETTLDESMKLFEEGIGLSRTCTKLLSEAQLKVTQLIAESDKEVEFDTENM